MKSKILSCNARGLNKGGKHLRVKNLLRQWKVDIICLQETKLEFISSSIVKNLWGCPYVEWGYVASRGASSGIFLMWYKRVVTKIEFLWGNLLLLVH
jgi:exonuclease III